MSLFDLAGLVGVVLIVIAYLLLQLGRLPSSAPSYSLLNAIGALVVMVSLYFDFDLSAFLMEAFWFLDQFVWIGATVLFKACHRKPLRSDEKLSINRRPIPRRVVASHRCCWLAVREQEQSKESR